MKVSVSLSDDDVAFLDEYAKTQGVGSRSAVLHKAVEMLRVGDLAGDYEQAWQQWSDSADSAAWDATTADGIEA